MNSTDSALSAPRRWVAAPKSARLPVPAVLGVYLLDGESVQWNWTHTPEGSYVSGYQIDGNLGQGAPILGCS